MKLAQVQPGDVLEVHLLVTEANTDDGITAQVLGVADSAPSWYNEVEVAQMGFQYRLKPTPPAPKVKRFLLGDEVYRTWDKSDRGEIKAVSGDKYWVAFGNGLHLTLTATDMVLI